MTREEPPKPEADRPSTRADRRARLERRLAERFDEPITKITELTQGTLALFPTRVWRRFLAGNGFLLSSGMSYQALFAVFAAVYVLFAVAGIWLIGSPATMDALIDLINTYVPGLIGDSGVIHEADLRTIATSSASVLTITGVSAIVVLIWTAIGWITYSRIAVRAIFGVPKDPRSYVLLKARDFVVSVLIGVALFAAAVLSVVSTAAIDWLYSMLPGVFGDWSSGFVTFVGLVLVYLIDTVALMVLFRVLANARLTVRRMLAGTLLGGGALLVLQVLGSTLLGGASRNPLLSTFVVFIAMLLWFRLTSVVTLVSASWIAVAAEDRGELLYEPTAAEKAALEQEALVIAAEVRLREATAELEGASWWRRPAAKWRRDAAAEELRTLAERS
ncbi:YihY/virulence factor BrkB family protein [Herbiconiux moechotypicola]|uniref:YihY/virulence factor BrkB family protein n=1 Tax=Herbiconiux moechotypicola TaxID=637393 RepID=A0ABN3D9Q2_9MICO|nr:YihY/virulence factor BrkB family protein [Herbiconiux moechotypicola]MCS5729064.1 YihY/virulence factor BrkB family protein [Herbiconiux moechotypicola]